MVIAGIHFPRVLFYGRSDGRYQISDKLCCHARSTQLGYRVAAGPRCPAISLAEIHGAELWTGRSRHVSDSAVAVLLLVFAVVSETVDAGMNCIDVFLVLFTWYYSRERLLFMYVFMYYVFIYSLLPTGLPSPVTESPWCLMLELTKSPWCFMLELTESPWCLMLELTESPWCLMLELTESPWCLMLELTESPWCIMLEGGGPRVVVSTAAFHARVRGSVPGLGGLKETKNVSSPSTCESQYCGEPPWPRGSVLGLRPWILCLEDSVILIISPSSGGSPGPV